MKRAVKALGIAVFWLGWPLWFFYFRLSPPRSRVFVVHDGKTLLLKTWLGNGSWGTPGGGSKRGEALADAAIRELAEEVGIAAAPEDLQPLGSCMHKGDGLKFEMSFYLLVLDRMPDIRLQKSEISDAGWFGRAELERMKLSSDTINGLKTYARQLLIK